MPDQVWCPTSFTLVEPLVADQLVDRPNLGCAMLLGACRERGLPASFVAGQSRVLAFLASLDPETLIGDQRPLGLFRELYDAVIGERGPRPHFNGHAVYRLQVVFLLIMRRLREELDAGEPCSIAIVEDYVQRIAATGCGVVGFSLHRGHETITREVRRRLRELGLTVIAGGPEVTRLDPHDYAEAMYREHVDYLVSGPGERILPDLLECLADGGAPDALPNVFSLHDGRVVGFGETVRQDLDALPFPDFSDVDLAGFAAPEVVLPLETARGCTWDRCAFCDHNAGPTQRYQAFSSDRVVAILKHLQTTYDCHEFALHDLELPPVRAGKLSRAIRAAGLDDLGLTALARVSPGYRDPKLWREMHAAGFNMIEWGLESGCQRTLDAMIKGTSVETAAEVLHVAAEAGVANECFILFGFPGETEEDARETVSFIETHRDVISRTVLDVLGVLPESPLGRDPGRWGVRLLDSGAYEVEEGMSWERAMAMAKSLMDRESFDPRRFSGDAVRSIATINAGKIMYGLLRGHRALETETAVDALEEGPPSQVFPLVLGDLRQSELGWEWLPIAIAETPLINLRIRPAGRVVDQDERDAFRLADGTRSLEEVCAAAPSGEAAALQRRAFVIEALKRGSGLAFGRRWTP